MGLRCPGGDDDPYTLSWRAIDAGTYYQQDPNAYVKMLNYSGCGNTVNANHHTTLKQIVDSLRQARAGQPASMFTSACLPACPPARVPGLPPAGPSAAGGRWSTFRQAPSGAQFNAPKSGLAACCTWWGER